MAASLRALRSATRIASCGIRQGCSSFSKRYLLSSVYSCTDAWKKSLESPSFGELSLSDLAVQIHEQLDKFGQVSAVDINIFAHQVDQLEGDEDEAEFVEDILKSYNFCQESFPPCPSTSHALVRGYITSGLASRLPSLLSDRLTFGIFPNFYTLNLLMDHFIQTKDYAQAARIAYCSTMQEDFSDPINVLLSLHACTQFLLTVNIDDLKSSPKEESDGDEDWIKVGYIPFPYYDDHFDIKDERFLLGKTLMMLSKSKSVDIPVHTRDNLTILGSGFYHKFDKGLATLNEILSSSDRNVSAHSLETFSESLQKVESRAADEPEVELALRTIDDVIHKMLPTHEEKEQFVSEFGRVKQQLLASGRVVENFELGNEVDKFVSSNIGQYEEADIVKQSSLFKVWRAEQDSALEKVIYELRKNERIEEMKKQIQELQEQEEFLNYFDKEEHVRMTLNQEDAEQSDPRLSLTKI